MVDLGGYLWGVVQLALVVGLLGFSAFRLRQRLLPGWAGAPARLVESITVVALVIWLSEILGTFGLFYAGALSAAALLTCLVIAFLPGGGTAGGTPPEEALATGRGGGSPAVTGPAGPESLVSLLVMLAVIAATVFSWGVTTQHAVDRGVFNFDSLWYHLPFAVDMVQTHSVVGMHHVETVFTNWFYPQNSELLHAVGILLTGRDTLSLFINFGWLAVAFLAAYCVGRPYGRGAVTTIAAAILLACHTLVVRDPGAAKNDLAAAALILASIAILVEAWAHRAAPSKGVVELRRTMHAKAQPHPGGWGRWALAGAGLAAGLAAGTRVTALAMAGALTVAVVALAPRGRRWAAAGWWFLSALAGGGFWYLRNLVVAGNPIPEVEKLGPISLPHPERLQEGRPDFNIVHYATDTGVWREYFAPGLHEAFGSLWPLVVFAAAAAALLALIRGRDWIVRWVGVVALFGLLAYLVTPLGAAGAEGEPVGFGINIRYVIPALLAGIVLLPLERWLDGERRQWGLIGALLLVFLITNRPDDALHDKARVFAFLLVLLAVVVPALLLFLRSRGASAALTVGAAAGLVVVLVAIGYPLQRHYLENRFTNEGPTSEQIPGMNLNSAYTWARDLEGARIGLVGTSAGFAGYGFYGTDLSNRVLYLGEEGPRGAFNAIPTCAAFRAAVNDADIDYLVTAPFLNFLHPGDPITSPETRWLRGERDVHPYVRSGPVTVWWVSGDLDPTGCGPRNAPLREIHRTPGS
jgi:ABC-type transport system involved in multi-copper enzyme maturation permease subunit